MSDILSKILAVFVFEFFKNYGLGYENVIMLDV